MNAVMQSLLAHRSIRAYQDRAVAEMTHQLGRQKHGKVANVSGNAHSAA